MHAHEPMSEDAALEEGAQLALDEPGHGMPPLLAADQERLELLAHDLIEHGALGLTPAVAAGGSRGA